MEGDRKYRQHGYNDSDREQGSNGGPRGDDRPRPQGPRPPIDVTGPRLPRLVQAVTAARCYNCAVTLPQDVDFRGNCPKCNAALHCCKQCAFFEPSTRFQCTKPILARISPKDSANECELFKPRVTVARDAPAHSQGSGGIANGNAANMQVPRNAGDARAAFDSLFKKT
jgi:hypothetical protein